MSAEVLKNYLIKDFFPEYKKFPWFLKEEFKGKLTRTNNNSEMYFHATLPKAEKKRYRTKNGVFNQISNRKKWLDEKNKIPTNKMTNPEYLFLGTVNLLGLLLIFSVYFYKVLFPVFF